LKIKIVMKNIFLNYRTIALVLILLSIKAFPQSTNRLPFLEKQYGITQLIVDDKPFLMLAGELHNSSTGGTAYMRPIWKRMADNNINTVLAVASWETLEPVEGEFNFELVDSMIIGARKEGLRLVVLWFGSWKNGRSTYVPEWVKKDNKRFPLVKDEDGNSLNIISTVSREARDADARAFAALMKHIKEIDSEEQTVLMVQVENEIGVLGAKRDFSEPANKAFNRPVPAKLMNYLDKHKSSIHPGVLSAWKEQGLQTNGTWEEVFGKGERLESWKDLSYLPEELFMAWNYASYVGHIAKAGRAEYNLPMLVNAWLKQPGRFGHAPGDYPSGGPTPQVIDVWRAAAPSIDLIAPDIYILDEYRYVCDAYTASENPLFIPETVGGAEGAARAFFTFGNYNTICFAPFGIDGGEDSFFGGSPEEDLKNISDAYAVLENLTPLIIENQGTNNLKGLLIDNKKPTDTVQIGGYTITGQIPRNFIAAAAADAGIQVVETIDPSSKVGGALIICTAPGEYIIAGRNMSFNYELVEQEKNTSTGILYLEEGYLGGADGKEWISTRRLNGDELRFSLNKSISNIYKVGFYQY